MQYSNFIFSIGVSLGTNRTWRTSHVFGPVSAGLAHEKNARTLLYRTSAPSLETKKKKSPLLIERVQFHVHVLEYSTEYSTETETSPRSRPFLVSWCIFFPFEVCPYGRRWVHINGFLPPIRRSPLSFLKVFTSDASHFNVPYPYRSVGRSQMTHTLSKGLSSASSCKLFVM
jgi:hypothetical protein